MVISWCVFIHSIIHITASLTLRGCLALALLVHVHGLLVLEVVHPLLGVVLHTLLTGCSCLSTGLSLAGVGSLGCCGARCSLNGASRLACGCLLLLGGCLLVVLVVRSVGVGLVGIRRGVGGLLGRLLLLGLLWLLLGLLPLVVGVPALLAVVALLPIVALHRGLLWTWSWSIESSPLSSTRWAAWSTWASRGTTWAWTPVDFVVD